MIDGFEDGQDNPGYEKSPPDYTETLTEKEPIQNEKLDKGDNGYVIPVSTADSESDENHMYTAL